MRNSEEPPRTKQLGLKVREDFYWEIKEIALKRRCCIVKVIEDSVELFQNANITCEPHATKESNGKLERKTDKPY